MAKKKKAKKRDEFVFEGRKIKTQADARQAAIDWQIWQSTQSMDWGEVAEWGNFFKALAKRFRLTEEFMENGII